LQIANWLHIPVCSEILFYQLCFDYGVFSEIIINLRQIKNSAFDTFQPYVAAILAPSLQTLHPPQFKNSGSKLNNALHFVELQDFHAGVLPSLYYRIVSKIIWFRDNIAPLFLSSVKNARPYSSNRKRFR